MKKQRWQWLLLLGTFGLSALAVYLYERYQHAQKVASDELVQLPPDFRKTPIRRRVYPFRRFFRETHHASFAVVGIFLLSFVTTHFLQEYSHLFRASLVGLDHAPFEGTTFPIKKVPNWVDLSEAERRMTYDQLPKSKLINLPGYDLQAFREGQVWRRDNEHERNAYITYPVPNLGNYELDGTENSGSHTGVDIKVPLGTPVHATANGVVYKVDHLTTGFGKHIVLAHVKTPDPQNHDRKITLFSTYAHLSEVLVNEGDEVKINQIVAKSGNSGMATTPHLHFQMDRAEAPFHPYWPFTWKDIQARGIDSYFEAVKRGIGKRDALRYTVHPIEFITAFVDWVDPRLVVSADEALVVKEPHNHTHEEETGMIPPHVVREEVKEVQPSSDASLRADDIFFETDRTYVPGKNTVVKVKVRDAELLASSAISVDSTLRHLAEISPARLTQEDFSNGVAEVAVKTDSTTTFKLVAQGDFGEVKSPSLRAQVFKDVETTHRYSPAITYLRENDIVQGYADGTFRPDNTLNRAEAVKILLVGNDVSVEEKLSDFPDVPWDSWYSHYVQTAFEKNILKGYPDGSFRPGNTINRAEFLKLAVRTAGFDPSGTVVRDPYQDVDKEAWFAPYFSFAKSHNLLNYKQGDMMMPASPITRAEAANVIYRISQLQR